MMLAYSAALMLALLLSAPWWLFRMATTQRYREGLRERLGVVPMRLKNFAEGKRVIWLHAVSVGEVLAATRLVTELEAALPQHRVLISTTTRTGQALARERFGAERVFYFPLDFAFAVRAYLNVLQPAALILMESELWPRLLHECAARRIAVAVVNARVSDRSFARSMRFRSLWQRMARHVTLWLAQSDEDAIRLSSLLASTTDAVISTGPRASAASRWGSGETPVFRAAHADTTVRVTGNLKYDIRAPQQNRAAETIRNVANGRPIIVAGSTVGNARSDEERWIITVWGGRAKNQCGAMLVLAPRHPERFEEVWGDAVEFPSVKLTELLRDANTLPTSGVLRPSCPADIVVVDTIGDLAAIYGVADIAFVGGSLLKHGGHNPLEAAQFGIPVVMGPSFENFRDIVRKMQATGGIAITDGEAEGTDNPRIGPPQFVMRDSLESKLVELLTHPEAARAMGERGRQVFEHQQGATARTVKAIVAMLEAGVA